MMKQRSSIVRINGVHLLPLLPDEIVLYKILPLLPWKTLVRFRCVCKSWDSFTRHPSFLRLRNNPTHHFFFLAPDPHSSQPFLYSAPHPDNGVVTTPLRPSFLLAIPNLDFSDTCVQSVNGLLLFHPRNNVSFYAHGYAFAIVANPTTGQVLALPSDFSTALRARRFSVSTHLGYDPVGDQFKVLRLIKYQNSLEVKVLTLGHTWWGIVTSERSFDMRSDLLSAYGKRGLCVNGAIYWRHSYDLLAFDVGTEQFIRMNAPPGYSYRDGDVGYTQHPDLAEIDGCLSLVGYSGHDLKLWILRDYQARLWEQKTISLPPGPTVFPFCRVPTGEILLLPLFLYHGSVHGVYYDMDTESSRDAVIMEMPLAWTPPPTFGEVDIVFCQESFRLLK